MEYSLLGLWMGSIRTISIEMEKSVILKTKLLKTIGLPCIPLALAVAVSPAAMGLSLRHDVALSSYETQVNTSPYSASGQFNTNHSGTLIASNWVLASAHGGSASTFTTSDGSVANVLQRIVFPGDTSSSNAFDGNDFALFELSSPINTVAPATLHDPIATGVSYTDLLTQIDGLTAVYGGGGETGTGDTGVATTVTGTRDTLAGTNVIDTVGTLVGPQGSQVFVDNLVLSDFDEDAPGPPNGVTALEVGLVLRDSGGGLWVDLGNGQGPVLIGVHSGVTDPDDDDVLGEYGHQNISTVLTPDAYNWIQTTIPEPSSLALIAAGGLMVMRRRR